MLMKDLLGMRRRPHHFLFIRTLGFIEHRHVWLNALFISQPIEHFCPAIGRVGGETLGV